MTKAIKQGLTIASRIVDDGGSRESFLLVVTFKDLYVGNGRDFLEHTPAGEEIKEFIHNKQLNASCLPFDYIYFLGPREFEWFLYLVKKQKLIPVEIIRRVIEADKRDKTLQFGQQLRRMFTNMVGSPNFVTEPCDALFGRVERKVSKATQ
jgi:hypothetical protein